MPELRFRFEKRGRAAYLSHLDVMRTFQRAFIRAGIRLRHSEGFNPHPRMSIALPLQLGCESVCEVLDVSLLEGEENKELLAALNAALPEGIRVLRAGEPALPVKRIAWAEWELRFPSQEEAEAAEEILRSPSLPVEKKTKRGVGTLDIAPHLRLEAREENCLRVLLKAGEPMVNTGDVKKALNARFPEEGRMRSLRLRFLNENMEVFED